MRFGLCEQEKIDRLYQCLKDKAMKYICSLPQQICHDYSYLRNSLVDRFGRKEPATTVRRKLAELRQHLESNEEFAEEIRRLVTQAYRGVGLEMQDHLAAEAFHRGYKKCRIAYEVMNKNPTTISKPLDLVTFLEHNYKATVGREFDANRKERTRQVSWADSSDEDNVHTKRIRAPSYVTFQQLDSRCKKIEDFVAKFCEKSEKQSRTTLSGKDFPPERREPPKCYGCGQTGHFGSNVHLDPDPPALDDRRQEMRKLQHIGTSYPKSTVNLTRLKSSKGSILIPISVNNIAVTAVVDTGADASVISQHVAEKCGLQVEGTPSCKLLNAETSVEMMAVGGVTATFQIAKHSWTGSVYVAPITDHVLLGMDVLSYLDANVFTKQGTLVIGDCVIEGHTGKTSDVACSKAVVAEDIIVPASSEIIVKGFVPDHVHGKTTLLDPSSLQNGLHVGSVLVETSSQIPVRILNLMEDDIRLKKNTNLGTLVEVQDHPTTYIGEQVRRTKTEEGKNETYMQEIIDKTDTGLTAQQRQDLGVLLEGYSDIFASNENDLGCFRQVNHSISTEGSIPIRQPARRTPLAFQGEEADHLQKMLNSGVVVPSTSEWSSPLVRKKVWGVRWCVDYRKLNDITVKDAFPLPRLS